MILRFLSVVVAAVCSSTMSLAAEILEASGALLAPNVKTVDVGTDGDACAWSVVAGLSHNKAKVPATECTFRLTTAQKPDHLRGVNLSGIGHKNVPKEPPNSYSAVSESERTSDGKTDNARAVASLDSFDTSQPPNGTADKASLLAKVTITRNGQFFSDAASRVRDPFIIAAGTHDYAPEITALVLTATGDGNGIVGVGFSGSSSSADPTLLWDLWLSLGTGEPFDLDFKSAPILGLDDATVESNLVASLDFSVPGTVRLLAPHTLFHARLTSAEPFALENVMEAAGSAAAPEPSTLFLFASVAAGLFFSRRRLRCQGAVVA